MYGSGKEVKGVKASCNKLDGVDMNGLRDLGDQFKEKLGEGVIVLASVNEGKVNLIATATDGAMKQGAHAGNLIKAIASRSAVAAADVRIWHRPVVRTRQVLHRHLKAAEEVLAEQIH